MGVLYKEPSTMLDDEIGDLNGELSASESESKSEEDVRLKVSAKQKKEEIESFKKWRKQRQKSRFASSGNVYLDLDFEDEKVFGRSSKKTPGIFPGDRSGGKAKQAVGQGKKQKKREFRNSKFGFGGRKGLKKQKTAETTNDLSGFNKKFVRGNKKK